MAGDSIFLKGSSHLVCEDYAQHLPDGFTFVGDGCSSADRSDIAARLSYLGMRQSFFDLQTRDSFDHGDMKSSDVRFLGEASQTESLVSTVLCARRFGPRLLVTVVGDGHLVLRRKDGTSQWVSFSYPTFNAPYYPAYTLDQREGQLWREQFSGHLHIKNRKWDGATEDSVLQDPWVNLEWDWVAEDLDYVLIASDGVGSFSDPQGKSASEDVVVDELCSFKNRTGEFLKRRVLRMMEDFQTNGIVHRDDFSAAILTF